MPLIFQFSHWIKAFLTKPSVVASVGLVLERVLEWNDGNCKVGFSIQYFYFNEISFSHGDYHDIFSLFLQFNRFSYLDYCSIVFELLGAATCIAYLSYAADASL